MSSRLRSNYGRKMKVRTNRKYMLRKRTIRKRTNRKYTLRKKQNKKKRTLRNPKKTRKHSSRKTIYNRKNVRRVNMRGGDLQSQEVNMYDVYGKRINQVPVSSPMQID